MRQHVCLLWLLASLLAAPSNVAAQASSSTPPASRPGMTNDQVIELVAAGLSEQVITNAITQASSQEFDLTPAGLLELKRAGVPDAVIVAMQEALERGATRGGATGPLGRYVRVAKRTDYIEFASDGTFKLRQNSENYTGTYRVHGDTVTFASPGMPSSEARLVGNQIIEPNGWVWEPDLGATEPTLTPPSAAAPAPSAGSTNGCGGIELMGLFKSDMRPAVPLILWFAKVRNATSVTRIVNVSWTNLYGQEKTSRAEVRSGDISTLELNRQMSNERQPINLRLSSCR